MSEHRNHREYTVDGKDLAVRRAKLTKAIPAIRAGLIALMNIDEGTALEVGRSLRQIVGNLYPELGKQKKQREAFRRILQEIRNRASHNVRKTFDQLLTDL